MVWAAAPPTARKLAAIITAEQKNEGRIVIRPPAGLVRVNRVLRNAAAEAIPVYPLASACTCRRIIARARLKKPRRLHSRQ
jgi:hypothetical protein